MQSKENTPSLLVGMRTCTTTLEISRMVSQKTGNQPTARPVVPLLGIYLKDVQPYYKDIRSTMFIEALFINNLDALDTLH